jgi:hypothetical protein
MSMSIQTLDESARQLQAAVLIDSIAIFDVGPVKTEGFNVTHDLTPAGDGKPVSALVQTTTLENAVESRVGSVYSIKVPKGTPLVAGQVIRVLFCRAEPDLSLKELLIDKVSLNGAAMIRKAVASDFQIVNQEGKP